MTDFFAVSALGCTLSIMVIVALRAQRHDSSKSKKNRVSMVLRVVLQKMECCELLH
nr:hypothetical protein [Tanacetum cinerariifolium]